MTKLQDNHWDIWQCLNLERENNNCQSKFPVTINLFINSVAVTVIDKVFTVNLLIKLFIWFQARVTVLSLYLLRIPLLLWLETRPQGLFVTSPFRFTCCIFVDLFHQHILALLPRYFLLLKPKLLFPQMEEPALVESMQLFCYRVCKTYANVSHIAFTRSYVVAMPGLFFFVSGRLCFC